MGGEDMDDARKTPLYDVHVRLGGKMTPFAGYMLPIQYSGILDEHHAVRQACGLFDVSHMGRFIIKGADAQDMLESLCTNDITGIAPMAARYTLLCNPEGGVIDDILAYRLPERFMLVVNASNREKVRRHLVKHAGSVNMEDISDDTAQIALQGPAFLQVLGRLGIGETVPEKRYRHAEGMMIAGREISLSTTGYTGEAGVEIYCAADDAPAVTMAIFEAGQALGIKACGLGCRDTLRMEAAMPLYGHELAEDISPLEAGLEHFVKLDKAMDFTGKQVLIQQAESGIPRTRIGLKLEERGIPRQGCAVSSGGTNIGLVTSGGYFPSLDGAYAMALVESAYASRNEFNINIRERDLDAHRVELPFYRRPQTSK
jgi:aminomethyltransferase